MAIIKNENDQILQAAGYRFINPDLVLTITDPVNKTALFTKPADTAALTPTQIVVASSRTLAGIVSGFATPTSYTWEYSTSSAPTVWIDLGVAYNSATLNLTNTVYQAHVGTTNTWVQYRVTYKYATEDNNISTPVVINYLAQANSQPIIELSKESVFLPTTTINSVDTITYTGSAFDINVKVGGVYFTYDATNAATKTFSVGTPTVSTGTVTLGTRTTTDRNKDLNAGTTVPDTVTYADVVSLTTETAVITYPVTIKIADGTVLTLQAQQQIVKARSGTNGANGARTAVLDLYQWSVSAPTLYPSGTSTYTWSTAQFTDPATLNSWTQTPGNGAAGQTLYTISQVYADSLTTPTSTVTWAVSSSRVVGVYGSSGTNGTRTAVLELYQWALTTPTTFPSGTSTYTWATGVFTSPTTPNSWSLTPGAATPGYTLYGCTVRYSDTLTTATNTITWNTSTAYILGTAGTNGTNGVNGTKSITISAFKWGTSIGAYTQAITYTWATGAVSAYPAGWASSALASTATGQTLYQINLTITDTATATTTNINWSAAVSNSVGYRQDGTIGLTGNSARKAFIVTTSGTAPLSPTAVTGDAAPTGWSFTATSSLTAGQYLYQVDGILSTTTGNITWGNPYLSNLKVGSLSAISADLGVVQISTTGSLSTPGKTYGATTAGIFLGYDSTAYKFDIGSSTNYLRWDGSSLSITGSVTLTNTIPNTSITGLGTLATKSAVAWSTDITSTPTELTDGRITTAISNTGAVIGNLTGTVNGTAAATVAANAAAVTTKLNKAAADTLSGPISLSSSGGIVVGTAAISATGVISGTGVAISSLGISGVKAGVATFSIGTDGSATFSGALSAATGTFSGTVSAGAITSSSTVDVSGYISATGTITKSDTQGFSGGSVITGSSSTAAAVSIFGISAGTGGIGVRGSSVSGHGVVGVTSSTTSYGVYGQSPDGGSAVVGTVGGAGSGQGVFGIAGTGTGVYGRANSTGTGTRGEANGGYGVYGTATTGTGVRGESTSAGTGVNAVSTGAGYSLKTSTARNLFDCSYTVASTTTYSHDFIGSGAFAIAMRVTSSGASSGAAQFFNTNSSKQFWTAPGGYSAYSPAGGGKIYVIDGQGPFTGVHDTLVPLDTVYEIGDIMVDYLPFYKLNVTNTLFEVRASSVVNQKGVIGVCSSTSNIQSGIPAIIWESVDTVVTDEMGAVDSSTSLKLLKQFDLDTLNSQYKVCNVNALGEGQLNVCGEGGSIAAGDLIVTSSIPGKGMRQQDDIVRNYTVAKARESVNFSSPNEIKQIACIYLCG